MVTAVRWISYLVSKLGVFTLIPGLSEKLFALSENYTFQFVRKMLIFTEVKFLISTELFQIAA